MNALTLAKLSAFWATHPDAEPPLREWLRLIRTHDFQNFAEVKQVFASADWVSGYIVFNIGGNKYRLIVRPNFAGKRMYIVFIGTHQQYDAWTP